MARLTQREAGQEFRYMLLTAARKYAGKTLTVHEARAITCGTFEGYGSETYGEAAAQFFAKLPDRQLDRAEDRIFKEAGVTIKKA